MTDGGTVALDWLEGSAARSGRGHGAIIVVLSTLTGGAQNVADFCTQASRAGHDVVVFVKRGHGGLKLTTPRLQAFGDTSDLQHCLQLLRDTLQLPQGAGGRRFIGVGFSAGSGLLVSYLGEFGADSLLDGGVCVSPGYDALSLFTHPRGVSPVYNALMTKGLKAFLRPHEAVLRAGGVVDWNHAMAARNIREFDERVYLPLNGFTGPTAITDYWNRNNPMRDVGRRDFNTSRPILCINALDDPVCTRENIDFDIFSRIDDVLLVTTQRGSHVCFFEGQLWPKACSRADVIALEYIAALLRYSDQEKTK